MSASMLPATLPANSDAQLPQRYEAARNAIAECERVDECKGWSDRAAALASYARQAKDDSLRVMAIRIQARAERRCGELLKQIPRADEATRYGQVATVPPVTRTQAATDAGLSERQRKTALRVAAIPAADFDARVESPRPPTVTQLANLGKVTRIREDKARATDLEVSPVCDVLAQFTRFCEQNEPAGAAEGCSAEDAAILRQCVATVDRWLDRFVSNLPG
jgi:hypothetical protein